jgi:hypothetical protein
MTKEDIIRMAREVGLEVDFDLKANEYMFRYSKDSLARFANLVAAHERKQWPEEMKAMERQVEILTDSLYKAAAALQLAALRARG